MLVVRSAPIPIITNDDELNECIDKIKLIGIDTREITFAANVSAKGVTGIGIYGKGILEALYTGGDLTVAQITQMTSGDASAAAMSNSVNAYGVW